MESILDNEFTCIISDSYGSINESICLMVKKEDFDYLLKICMHNKKCLQIIYDFSLDDKEGK